MNVLKIFIQSSPQISALAVGGIKCVLDVGFQFLLLLKNYGCVDIRICVDCYSLCPVLREIIGDDGTHRKALIVPFVVRIDTSSEGLRRRTKGASLDTTNHPTFTHNLRIQALIKTYGDLLAFYQHTRGVFKNNQS
jgi:hypothetical protein